MKSIAEWFYLASTVCRLRFRLWLVSVKIKRNKKRLAEIETHLGK